MLRTRKLNKLLKKIARISPRAWKFTFTIGIFVSFAFTIFGFYYFVTNLATLIINYFDPPESSQISPLIPGVTIDLNIFMYLVIPILFVVTVHEFGHAIAANSDGIPVKSTGVFGAGLFLIIGFGAFVEVDEKKYRRGNYSGWQKARLSAAGSFANSILAIIALLIVINFTGFVSPFWQKRGLVVNSVSSTLEGGYNDGILYPDDIILTMNGTEINDHYDLSDFLSNATPNSTINATIERNGEILENFTIQTGEPPPDRTDLDGAYVGITSEEWWYPKNWFSQLFGGRFPNVYRLEILWTYIIAISVTMFNMMPLPIFDGDKVVYTIIEHFIKPKKEKKEVNEKFLVGKEGCKMLELDRLKVEKVEKITLKNKNDMEGGVVLEEFKDYQLVDSDEDDMIDNINFEIKDEPIIEDSVIEIDYVAEIDVKERKKKWIMNTIRAIALVIIIGNFLVSYLAFGGFSLPFMG